MPDLSDLIVKKIPDAADMCFGIVVAEKKADITEALLRGAVETLEANGALSENIHVKTVPSISDLVYGAHQMSLQRLLRRCDGHRMHHQRRDSLFRLCVSGYDLWHIETEQHERGAHHLWSPHHRHCRAGIPAL